MDNSTFPPENDTSLNSPGFMAYSILLAMAIVVGSVMIVFTILALLMATAVPRLVRLFLINLLQVGHDDDGSGEEGDSSDEIVKIHSLYHCCWL